MQNGDLLEAAELAGFNVLVTTDQNLRYQQNLANRRIAILVLKTTSWPKIRSKVSLVVDALNALPQAGYIEIGF